MSLAPAKYGRLPTYSRLPSSMACSVRGSSSPRISAIEAFTAPSRGFHDGFSDGLPMVAALLDGDTFGFARQLLESAAIEVAATKRERI